MTQRHNHAPVGVLLMNTGTPASPDPADIRPYLAEFLSDRRLIDLPRFLWLPILHGIILRTRPKKTSPHYARIWTPEGSPFLLDSLAQRHGLQCQLDLATDGQPHRYVVELAMRYGQPSLTNALDALESAGCQRVICMPLFPQAAFATTGSCQDVLTQQAAARPDLELDVVTSYGAHSLWRQALANSIKHAWTPTPGSKLLFAFHSIPVSNVEAGDTYPHQVNRDTAAVAELLGLGPDDWAIGFQSRFDSRKWLQPTPEKTLAKWAAEGVRNVAVVAPGFATDCLETLRECAQDQRDLFLRACAEADASCAVADVANAQSTDDATSAVAGTDDAGDAESSSSPGASFVYVPCLGACPSHLECLARVVLEQG